MNKTRGFIWMGILKIMVGVGLIVGSIIIAIYPDNYPKLDCWFFVLVFLFGIFILEKINLLYKRRRI